ncbi:MAG: type II toxin-antitoxin system VapC family toxin, partial [Spirochaeta sp.]|nr:type II toxin-antitoxin system VapC family toxin [Spirochaeta sp.]
WRRLLPPFSSNIQGVWARRSITASAIVGSPMISCHAPMGPWPVTDHLHYLDTSVVLAWLLEGSEVLAPLQGNRRVASSRLLWTEVARGLYRALQTGRLSAAATVAAQHRFARIATRVATIRLNELVLRRAEGPYPVLIRSLDAIHLASAELWLNAEFPAGEPERVSVWSFDNRMNQCAALLGFGTPCS